MRNRVHHLTKNNVVTTDFDVDDDDLTTKENSTSNLTTKLTFEVYS